MRFADSRIFSAKAHPRLGRRGAVRVEERPDRDVARIEPHHQEPRQEAREEDLDDRDVRGDRVDHHGDGGRDQDAERPGAGERAEAHHVVVAAPLQFRQGDLGDGRAGGGRGARHRAEDAAGEHVDVQEPARDPVEPGREAAEHLLREARAEQDLAHPDEERQGREGPGGGVAPDRRREDRARRDAAADELHADPAAGHQRDGDPHAAGEEGDQEQEQEAGDLDERHGVRPRSGWRARPPPRRLSAAASRSAGRRRARTWTNSSRNAIARITRPPE